MSLLCNSPLTGIAQPDNIGASGDYTIMCWVRINAAPVAGQYRAIFTRVDGTYTKWAGLFTRNDGNRRIYIKLSNGTTTVSSAGNFTFTTGEWTHVALTKGATGGFTLIANGGSNITANLDLSAVAFAEVLAGSDAVAAVSNLEVAYYREWNAKLTLDEVKIEMCSMTPHKLANLLTDTTLDGHYNDATPNLNHWTPFGASTFTPQVTFPVNGTYVGATLVPSLPFTETVPANYSGKTFDLWYKFVATYTGMIGAFGYGGVGGAFNYDPVGLVYGEAGGVPVNLPNGLTSAIRAYNAPMQVPVEQGKTYFFFFDGGQVATAELRVELYGFTQMRYPPGALMIPDDTSGFDGAILSPTTGKVLNFARDFPAGEEGDSLELREVVTRDGSVSTGGGEVLVQDDLAEGLKLYDKYLVLKIAIDDLSIPFLRDIQAHHSANPKFYLLYDSVSGFTGFLKTITVDGAWGPKTWTFPSAWFLSGVTVNQAQTIAYLSDSGGIIRRWDLINDVALPDFPTTTGSNRFYILKNDHFVIARTIGSSGSYSVVLDEYLPDGTLLHSYTFPGMQAANVRPGPNNPLTIWLWLFNQTTGPDSGFSTFVQLRLSDGVHEIEFKRAQYETGSMVPDTSSNPEDRFGHSFSCPFYTLPAGSPVPPPIVPGPVDGEVVPIRRLRQAPHLTDEHKVIRYNRFWLDMMTGIGTTEGQGQNPVVYLSWSDDGGKRWSNEYPLYAGKLGAYKWRAMRRRLGSGRDRIFRVTMSDPVDWVLIDAFIEIAKGTT